MLCITCQFISKTVVVTERKEVLTHSRLKVYENGAWDVMLVVRLIKEHIFPVPAFCGPFLQDPFVTDAVFSA